MMEAIERFYNEKLNIGKCAVCNKETDTVVACSTCGGICFEYCQDCIQSGFEPYSALVGMGLYSNEMSKQYRENILIPSLKFHNKTIEQFDEDVKEEEEAFIQFMKDFKSEPIKDDEF